MKIVHAVPNTTVLVPRDPEEALDLIDSAIRAKGYKFRSSKTCDHYITWPIRRVVSEPLARSKMAAPFRVVSHGHELVHVVDQVRVGRWKWWASYPRPKFRLRSECLAWEATGFLLVWCRNFSEAEVVREAHAISCKIGKMYLLRDRSDRGAAEAAVRKGASTAWLALANADTVPG